MAPSSERSINFLTIDADRRRIILNVHLQHGAKSSALAGVHGDALKIRIAAPAVDNKANTALVVFLSILLNVPANNVRICSGLHSRRKRIEIIGATDQAVTQLCAKVAVPAS